MIIFIIFGDSLHFYNNIPNQVDYFFDIPRNVPKYIAHVDSHGYGLLHLSTERLRSRKLFCWGHNEGSDNWQHFLTQNAGPYVEIQGGLGKTQYGCIPMAPHTAYYYYRIFDSEKQQIIKKNCNKQYNFLLFSVKLHSLDKF